MKGCPDFAKSVPWKDWDEWSKAYKSVISDSAVNYDPAISLIKQWKYRSKLPVAIEATGYLLDIFVNDQTVNPDCVSPFSPSQLALMYGQVISRFVNLLTDMAQKGVYAASMDLLAGSIEIPSWVVQVRHSSAHGTIFPSLSFLRKAAFELLDNFIIPKYWVNQMQLISEGHDEAIPTVTEVETPLWSRAILNKYFGIASNKDARLMLPTGVVLDGCAIHWLATNIVDAHGGSLRTHVVDLLGGIHDITNRLEIVRQAIYYCNTDLIKLLLAHGDMSHLIKLQVISFCVHADNESTRCLLSCISDQSTEALIDATTSYDAFMDQNVFAGKAFVFSGLTIDGILL